MADPVRINKNCRELIFEAVFQFFGVDRRVGLKARSIETFVRFLESSGLTCMFSCPWYFVFSPLLWRLFIRNWISEEQFESSANCVDKKAIVHLCSAKSIYGIDEYWTHYVCQFFSPNYHYFDPYLDKLDQDYPQLTGYYSPPLEPELLYNDSIRILIFRPT